MSETKQLSELVGRRILFGVHIARDEGNVYEGEVEELSPSGKFVNVGRWHEVEKVSVLEVLPTDDEARVLAKEAKKRDADQDKSDAADEKAAKKRAADEAKAAKKAAADGVKAAEAAAKEAKAAEKEAAKHGDQG